MGMFDYITCEMSLPESEDKIPCHEHDHQFQTKDLWNALIEYKIGEDKTLYKRKAEYEEKELTEEDKKDRDSIGFWSPSWCLEEKSYEWIKDDHTGYVNFYDFIHDVDDEHDAWREYRVHLKDGVVQGEIELFEYRKETNKERKESKKLWIEKGKAQKEYEKKWRYKYFGYYWNRSVSFVFSGLHKFLNWKRKWNDWFLSNLWKFEAWLKFFKP